MFLNINIPEIIIADSIGLLILFICAFGSMYRERKKNLEGVCYIILIVSLASCCFFETIVSIIDGNSGIVTQNNFTVALNLIGNTINFIGNMLMACCWSIFLTAHLNGYVKKRRVFILAGVFGIYSIVMLINLFVPFIFSVDENGVYNRVSVGYIVNVLIAVTVFVIEPIINFIRIKRKGGLLKFFPIWLFYIPITVGILCQVLFYGISTIYVGLCLGICGILMASQNDVIFRDKLTGLYNRYFLDRLKEKMMRKRGDATFTAMMLDLNGFKKINDVYGHSVGDEALVYTANLLREAIGSLGTVIRYAGDEFVVILNTSEDELISQKIEKIQKTFQAFNDKKLVPYELSISMGYSKTNLKENTIDEIMNEIDEKMYQDKMKQHELHPEWNRA